jgi:thioredoxin reductase (NADPH)
MESNYDVIIIGAGPVGLYTASYAGMRGLSVLIVDAQEVAGGKLATLYPTKRIYDVPGYDAISAQELVEELVTQTKRFNVDMQLNYLVEQLDKREDGYVMNNEVCAPAVILAIGYGTIAPKLLEIPHPQTDKIIYHLPDAASVTDQVVVISGGGDSAVDAALSLVETGKEVYLIHRRDQFRATAHSLALLEASAVQVVTPVKLKQVEVTDDERLHIVMEDGRSIDADLLVVSHGAATNTKLMTTWQVPLVFDRRGVRVNESLKTSAKQIYAIGDAAKYDVKSDMIAIGFGEGPLVVNRIIAEIKPEIRTTVHSSSLFEQ